MISMMFLFCLSNISLHIFSSSSLFTRFYFSLPFSLFFFSPAFFRCCHAAAAFALSSFHIISPDHHISTRINLPNEHTHTTPPPHSSRISYILFHARVCASRGGTFRLPATGGAAGARQRSVACVCKCVNTSNEQMEWQVLPLS